MDEDRKRADRAMRVGEILERGLATGDARNAHLDELVRGPQRELARVIDSQLGDPDLLRQAMRERAGYADTMVAALKRQIDPLLPTLKPDEEIGALLTSFGVSFEITVVSIGHEDPHLIIIKGVDGHGEEVSLFQHVSQVNILFRKKKVSPGKPARRIGFC